VTSVTGRLSEAVSRSYTNIVLARRDLALRQFPSDMPDLEGSLRTAPFSRVGLFGRHLDEAARRVEAHGQAKMLATCADFMKRRYSRSRSKRGRGSRVGRGGYSAQGSQAPYASSAQAL
jgi:hypothetical protein